VAIGALAATLVLAVAGGALWSQLGERDRSLQAVAEALANGEAAHRVEGEAGRGFVIETAGAGATLVLGEVAQLPPDRLYELWLIDAEGTPLAVGTFTQDAGPVVVRVEADLADFAIFAVTVEAQRVDAPTTTPVMAGELTG
jgi:HAMP domain-containing protein